MKYDEFLREIGKQIRYSLPENLFLIDMKSSKTSHYFYCGTETQFDLFHEGEKINESSLIKLRISNHDAICGRSYSFDQVILNYIPATGCYSFTLNGDEDYEMGEEKEAAKLIGQYLTKNLHKMKPC